jgi:hypothetical protein
MTANTATINTATNTELSTPELLTNVRKAGRNVAKAFSVGIAAIQTASEHGVELSDIRGAYITGYMGDYLDCDDVKAQHYLSLPGYEQDAKDSDKRRTKTQEMAYGAARVSWLNAGRQAGVLAAPGVSNKSKSKTASKKGAKKAGNPTPQAPITVQSLVIPRTKDVLDVGQYMSVMSAHLQKFHADNAANFIGDAGMKYRDAIVAFATACKLG